MHKTREENLILFYVLTFTLGIIWTLVGLVAYLGVLLYKVIRRDKINLRVYRGRLVVEFKDTYFGGASLGAVIFVSDSPSEDLLNHEIGHTIQNTFMGPLFIFLVAIPSGIRYQLFDWLDKRHKDKTGEYLDYDKAWFEGQATKLGDKHLVNKKYDWVYYRKKN